MINSNNNDNNNQYSAARLEQLAALETAEIIAYFLKQCADLGVLVPIPNPSLDQIHCLVHTHLDLHRSRPIVEFSGGAKEWSAIQRNLSELERALEKIISLKLQALPTAGCGRDPQPEPLTGGRASERPPGEGRATPGRDADDTRSTPGAQPHDPAQSQTTGMPNSTRQTPRSIKQARAEYLAELQRERDTRSPIDDLPLDRRQTLYEMLQEYDATVVREIILEPEPLGWNFRIGVSSLKRFIKRYKRQLEKAERLRIIADAAKAIEELGPGNAKAIEAGHNLIKLRFIDAARDPEASDRELQILSRILDRQRRTDLAERKQTFIEQQAND